MSARLAEHDDERRDLDELLARPLHPGERHEAAEDLVGPLEDSIDA